jgi:transcriptional regulator with XRE-family HTH domain
MGSLNLVNKKRSSGELGDLLRHWRDLRCVTQFDLSSISGVSQRHISFIESGRSSPSRQTLVDLAQALDVPLRDRNGMLLVAGYAPLYSDAAWDSTEMRSITRALERMLHQHEPYPAIVMDRHWNVVLSNKAVPRFFNRFIDLSARSKPRNLLHLMFDPSGMRPFIADWEQVAQSLILRVYRESVGRIVDDKTKDLVAALLEYPGVRAEWKIPNGLSMASALPVVPIGFMLGSERINYFSMVTTVGTPQTIAAQELRVECLFPADDATEAFHGKWIADESIQSSRS